MVPLDGTDNKILKELVKDGRLSYRQVAKRIGVAVGTVQSRMRRMEEEGVIQGYSVLLDYDKLGYALTVVTEITVSKGKLSETEKAIAELTSSCAVYDVTGLTDAIVIAKFRNRDELSNFTKGLLKMQFIERTNTHVVLSIHKEDFRLPI
jgi:DNA-binding Lrp family transcriptional regulator